MSTVLWIIHHNQISSIFIIFYIFLGGWCITWCSCFTSYDASSTHVIRICRWTNQDQCSLTKEGGLPGTVATCLTCELRRRLQKHCCNMEPILMQHTREKMLCVSWPSACESRDLSSYNARQTQTGSLFRAIIGGYLTPGKSISPEFDHSARHPVRFCLEVFPSLRRGTFLWKDPGCNDQVIEWQQESKHEQTQA